MLAYFFVFLPGEWDNYHMCWYGMCHSWGAFFAQKINFRVSFWEDHKWINILGSKNNSLAEMPHFAFLFGNHSKFFHTKSKQVQI